jgi:hypothetical protein
MAVIGNAPATTGTTVSAQSFNGDNSTVAFTLTRSVNSTVDLEVLVDNVQQSPYDGSYSVSGTTLTFSAAPATGTNNIYVIYRGATIATAQVIPDDGSVTNAKMASGAALANVGTGNITADYLNVGQLGGRRNLIINGAMQVAQRGTSSTESDIKTVDRWAIRHNSDGAFTQEQSTDAPAGFKNSFKVTIDTADTNLTGSQGLAFRTYLEGNSVSQLSFGTADAETITLSFWVKSSLTGDFGGNVQSGASTYRSYTFEYTINTADTWEYKTVTVVGDTSDVASRYPTDNSAGLKIWFGLGLGPDRQGPVGVWSDGIEGWQASDHVSVIGTLNATWQITGIQLEVGSVATPFEHRSYGEELALCERYYQQSYANGTAPGTVTNVNRQNFWRMGTGTYAQTPVYLSTRMRSSPTTAVYSPATGAASKVDSVTDKSAGTQVASEKMFQLYVSGSLSNTQNTFYHWTADAEL